MMVPLLLAGLLQATAPERPTPPVPVMVVSGGVDQADLDTSQAVLAALDADGLLSYRPYADARLADDIDDCWRTAAGLTAQCALDVLNHRHPEGRTVVILVGRHGGAIYWSCLSAGQVAASRAPQADLGPPGVQTPHALSEAAACVRAAADRTRDPSVRKD